MVEISTLCADQAYLTFDRPINNLGEIGNRKVVAAELFKHIKVTNNHRTASRNDDLHIYIDHGPLYYDEPKHLIWTKDDVYLKDEQSKPKPTEIRGHMMDMELLTDAQPAKPGTPQKKQRSENVTGVKTIILHSDVEMNLYVDGQSGFPGARASNPPTLLRRSRPRDRRKRLTSASRRPVRSGTTSPRTTTSPGSTCPREIWTSSVHPATSSPVVFTKVLAKSISLSANTSSYICIARKARPKMARPRWRGQG